MRYLSQFARPLESFLELDVIDSCSHATKHWSRRPVLNDFQEFKSRPLSHRNGMRPSVLALDDEQVIGQHFDVSATDVEEHRTTAEITMLDLEAEKFAIDSHSGVNINDHRSVQMSQSPGQLR